MTQRVVVVGASLAGLRAAEAVRKAGFRGQVTVVGDEPHMPYNRPPLSKTSIGDVPEAEWLKPGRHATDVEWRLGQTVTSADLAARTLRLASGEVLSWTGLVVASGLRPRRLDLPGPMLGRHVLRTLDDQAGFVSGIGSARRLVIVGAGFIGCEVAAAAAMSGIETHVVAPEAVPVERPLGAMVGAEIQRRLEALGIEFHLGTVPVEFLGADRVRGVRLADSTELAADAVLEAVGSIPNVEWLAGNGLDLSDGVLCDADCRVGGRSDVVACGDVARFPNMLFDEVPRRVEHWVTAVDTAKRAGQVLAAQLGGTAAEHVFAPVPAFWSHQGPVRLQAFGAPGLGDGEIRLLEGELSGEAAVGYYREGIVVGVVLLGLAGRYGHYRKEIETLSANRAAG
ncbi:NAD(P)/FAD-dependent oxidoreductase [Nocardia miyunensis]|uniref:NAD(P)/FAD-dependent oxidoreductase n=1 Tax=Nocardia miyunensis TaxID=282684 RepID=UPI00082FBF96|nr:FAD-dependent oxidoreductase [Nocardia miyunensis]